MRSPAALTMPYLPLLWFGSCTPLESKDDLLELAAAGSSAGTIGSPESAGAGGEGATRDGPAGGQSAAHGGEGGADAAPSCPAPEGRDVVVVAEQGELTLGADTLWSCEQDYLLQNDVIVAPGVKLTLDAGTTLRFAADTMLLVQRGGSIDARGTAQQPITLTSAKPEGTRSPGDYRGLILIGNGPSHSSTVPVHDSLSDARAHYGGGQAGALDDSCGSLRYVRVQFAGGSVDDTTLPAGAVTLAGCGSETVVDYLQIHRATDGLGLLGGTAPLRHVLVTNNLYGEAVEWSAGYAGTMQFIVAQSLGASAAIQGSNSAEAPEAAPVSRPTIYNATLLGSAPPALGQHYGLLLQLGSGAVLKNSVIQGFGDAAFDLDESVMDGQVGPGKPVDISHALMHDNAQPYSKLAAVLANMESMRLQDPGLLAGANPTEQMPDAAPVFAPTDPTVNTQPAIAPAGFDSTAGYRGAVPQDGLDWTLDWTSYPRD